MLISLIWTRIIENEKPVFTLIDAGVRDRAPLVIDEAQRHSNRGRGRSQRLGIARSDA